MSFSVAILADSVSPVHSHRLTTVEATFPRIILSELNTHRMLSRNSSSSRAIPTRRILEEIRDNPFIPEVFGSYQPGMVSGEPLEKQKSARAKMQWISASQDAIRHAIELAYGSDDLFEPFMDGVPLPAATQEGVHKELVNRIIEPYTWQTAIISATQWENFFRLRCAPDAQPQINKLANMIREKMHNSTPIELEDQQWHLPLVSDKEKERYQTSVLPMLSAGRCARVSYLSHDVDRPAQKDIELAQRLIDNGHMSPFEHQAITNSDADANFRGWTQFRSMVEPYDSRA